MSAIEEMPSRPRDADGETADVAVVRWPEDRERAADLAAADRPYLMLVPDGVAPPSSWPVLADWIRVPADESDLCHRLATLRRRAAWRSEPRVDDDDVLWRGGGWVGLSPTQARLMRILLERPGSVVARSELCAEGWPGRRPADRSVDVYVGRLRARIRELGLHIGAVRRRGYVLEVGELVM